MYVLGAFEDYKIWGLDTRKPVFSLISSFVISLFLAILCSWAGWFESHFFPNPDDSFSHATAYIFPTSIIIPISTN